MFLCMIIEISGTHTYIIEIGYENNILPSSRDLGGWRAYKPNLIFYVYKKSILPCPRDLHLWRAYIPH